MTDRNDRIKGVLTGQAAGDALGAGYEFARPPKAGTARMIGGGLGPFEPGEWTDDTQQAIIVASARSDPGLTAAGLVQWYREGPKDVGMATAIVLGEAARAAGRFSVRAIAQEYADHEAMRPRPPHWDPGGANGSLMRTGPVCLPFLGDREAIAKAARAVSSVTHADPYCGDACVLWSLAIDQAVREPGWVPVKMYDYLAWVPVERREYWREQIWQALDRHPSRKRFGMNGSAAGCFRAALSAVAHARGSLEDGLQKAVAIGGDTDTVAAVAGALLGAIHGASAVPDDWRRMLHGWPGLDADDLESLALQAAGSVSPDWQCPACRQWVTVTEAAHKPACGSA